MAHEKLTKKIKNPFKRKLGYSPVQKTASGSGFHEKTGKRRRRDERRKARQELRQRDDF